MHARFVNTRYTDRPPRKRLAFASGNPFPSWIIIAFHLKAHAVYQLSGVLLSLRKEAWVHSLIRRTRSPLPSCLVSRACSSLLSYPVFSSSAPCLSVPSPLPLVIDAVYHWHEYWPGIDTAITTLVAEYAAKDRCPFLPSPYFVALLRDISFPSGRSLSRLIALRYVELTS